MLWHRAELRFGTAKIMLNHDHVSPPAGAIAPQLGRQSRDQRFNFDRFGVRAPAIAVSSYVEPGTVFRASSGEPPYDHTSILATLRDWPALNLDKTQFLAGPRMVASPTLNRVLTRTAGNEKTAWPDITTHCNVDGKDISLDTPLKYTKEPAGGSKSTKIPPPLQQSPTNKPKHCRFTGRSSTSCIQPLLDNCFLIRIDDAPTEWCKASF